MSASEAEAKRLQDFAAKVAEALPEDALEARLRLSLLLSAALAHKAEADSHWLALKQEQEFAREAERDREEAARERRLFGEAS